jgi:Uma2 family endonuclease
MKTSLKWTLEDYHYLIDKGILAHKSVELIEGELREMSPESPFHGYITEGIVQYLRKLLQGLALVKEAHPITLSNSEPEPDLAIVKLSRNRYRDRHPYAEDIFWLMEVSNKTLNYDLHDKKKVYAKAGIREYWVIDINSSKIYVFINPEGDDYKSKMIVTEGIIQPLAFRDVKVSIDRLWL